MGGPEALRSRKYLRLHRRRYFRWKTLVRLTFLVILMERHVDLANKADQIEDKGSATYSFYYT
jgi:hypothetical protein